MRVIRFLSVLSISRSYQSFCAYLRVPRSIPLTLVSPTSPRTDSSPRLRKVTTLHFIRHGSAMEGNHANSAGTDPEASVWAELELQNL